MKQGPLLIFLLMISTFATGGTAAYAALQHTRPIPTSVALTCLFAGISCVLFVAVLIAYRKPA